MRLDKFLKLSRIIKRRTEAKNACENQCVKINGRTAKAGDSVKVFDKIEVRFKNRILEIEVKEVPAGNIPASFASSLYHIIKEEKISVEE